VGFGTRLESGREVTKAGLVIQEHAPDCTCDRWFQLHHRRHLLRGLHRPDPGRIDQRLQCGHTVPNPVWLSDSGLDPGHKPAGHVPNLCVQRERSFPPGNGLRNGLHKHGQRHGQYSQFSRPLLCRGLSWPGYSRQQTGVAWGGGVPSASQIIGIVDVGPVATTTVVRRPYSQRVSSVRPWAANSKYAVRADPEILLLASCTQEIDGIGPAMPLDEAENVSAPCCT
jgi:hypothetical protein